MKTTMDAAGRLVIPKEVRRESGLQAGMPLEIRWQNGRIEIEPAPLAVTVERKGRLAIAVPRRSATALSADAVENVRRRLRRERAGR